MRSHPSLASLVFAGALACGSHPPPAAAPAASVAQPDVASSSGKSTPVQDDAEPSDSGGAKLPTACADPKASVCTPPGAFVERLCAKPHQDVTLALFEPSTPFTRGYLRGRLDELTMDEEVLVLRFHAPQKNGIVVGNGNGTYDLLRWDGSCSTGVEAEMVTRNKPPHARSAHLQWHRLPTPLQDALIASSDAVKRAHAKRGKECKGAMSGDVSAACQKADEALVTAVVEYVRGGGALPPATLGDP